VAKLSLDDFVAGLQDSVAQAQERVDKANRGRLERQVELARDGQPEALTWSFVIDQETGAGPRTVRLPLLTMHPHRVTAVTDITLELRAVVEEAPKARGRTNAKGLRLIVKRRLRAAGQQLHTLTVRLTGKQPGKVQVRFDGVQLREIDTAPAEAESDENPTSPLAATRRQ
jgi:hypothetical protein